LEEILIQVVLTRSLGIIATFFLSLTKLGHAIWIKQAAKMPFLDLRGLRQHATGLVLISLPVHNRVDAIPRTTAFPNFVIFGIPLHAVQVGCRSTLMVGLMTFK
jgi:hypothetical protein